MKRKNRWRGKILSSILGVAMLLQLLSSSMVIAANNTQTVDLQQPFRELSVDEIVKEMGTGWNLGNTMDGHSGFTPGETVWQPVETTKELIKSVHDLGFNTVRIPVTWGTKIDDNNNYTIDEAWLSRVQDIVDYCVSLDMYAIVNIHHDGAEQSGWLRVAAEDQEPVREKFAAVWAQIAERFKDYDEHVIFESMNEVVGDDNSADGIKSDMENIMALNQIFVDTVRSTGSNNGKRFLSVPGRYTNIDITTDEKNGFALPNDTVENRLFVAVHYYDWHFGLLENTSYTEFGESTAQALARSFQKLVDKFTSKGIPVILGEYGAINKMNTAERAYHMEIVNMLCQQDGIVPVYWDQGWYDLTQTPDFSFTLIDRATGDVVYKDIVDGIMRGYNVTGPNNATITDISKNVTVNEITKVTLSSESVSLHIGDTTTITAELEPTDTNDVLLWKSDDETVATVYNGMIHGKGIGSTTIRAYSQSGSLEMEIKVLVLAQEVTIPCTGISVDAVSLEEGQSLYLNPTVTPENTDTYLTFRSSNESICTVSSVGKVVAKASGKAFIIITSSDGYTTTVPVTVGGGEGASKEIVLSLHVLYNDNDNGYFGNELGTPITVTGDGQYTVTFDYSTDMSATAKSSGITGISKLTALYIKDFNVTKGTIKKSPLVSCDIVYDKVVVDGKELTITKTEPKSALKDSGIFDTNDPLNSWEGAAVEEVDWDETKHVISFAGIENPQKVEVTFTLSNLSFEEGAVVNTNVEPESISLESSNLSLANVGETVEITANVSPANATSKVTFVAADSSVIAVDHTAVTPDAEGNVTVTLTALSAGTTTITAMTENGMTATLEVSSEGIIAGATDDADNEVDQDKEDAGESNTDNTITNDTDSNASNEASSSNAKNNSSDTMQWIAIGLGIVVLGAVVFFVVLKVSSGSTESKKKNK